MGQTTSKTGPTLAEKRYKVEKPPIKRRSNTSNGKEAESKGSKDTSPKFECPMIIQPNSAETKDVAVIPTKTNNGSKHFLSRRERILLEHSWKKTRKTGSEHVGSKIFLMVLTAQPDIKAIFGLEKIPQGRLKYDPRFRQHATVFTRTFDYVIKNIDYPEKLENHFEALGRRHVIMQGRGFDPLYWETFAECMTQAAVEWEANRQRPTLGAWRTLVTTIIIYMRRGFDEENMKRRL
ncbi:unnamed protein product [Auanema sp. JU1783]|nr:unnamed protein product [Auanema sp. JU1783]